MKSTSVRLPEDLERRLVDLSRARGTSRSEVLRAALFAFRPDLAVSFSAAASDLVGCVRGPKDLSGTKKHMLRYGS